MPESMSPCAYSYSSGKVSVADEDDYTNKLHKDNDDDDEDDEINSSYFFEINPNYREGTDEGVGVEEAIAWAKQSYQSHSSSTKVTGNVIYNNISITCKIIVLEKLITNWNNFNVNLLQKCQMGVRMEVNHCNYKGYSIIYT